MLAHGEVAYYFIFKYVNFYSCVVAQAVDWLLPVWFSNSDPACFVTADKHMSSSSPAPKSNVRTRTQARSEGVSAESRIQTRTLPDNYGPKSLEILPDNFVVDPNSLGRRARAPRKKKRFLHSN